MRKELKKPWYPLAAALCIAAAFYVLLTHLRTVGGVLKTLGSFFSPVVMGLVLAYLMNPLYRLFQGRVFKRVKREKLRRSFALTLTVLLVMAFLALLGFTLIPQLVSSVKLFIGNLDGYVEKLEPLLARAGFSLESIDYAAALRKMSDYLQENAGNILNATITAGKSVGGFVIGFMLAIYMLAEKERLKSGAEKLIRLLLSPGRFDGLAAFLRHSDDILIRYILYSLLESLIVAGVNAAFMLAMGMSYAPLVSFIVGLTNLIPTFGPIIGAAFGAFVLVLVRPSHALWFLVFTVVLQSLDGYVLKPRLFGNSLGVSGMWILLAIVVGGKMFGVIGMLLAIPCAAIIVDVYIHYLIPWLERRRERRAAPEKEEQPEG